MSALLEQKLLDAVTIRSMADPHDEIVLTDLPVIKAGTHPANEKVRCSLMSKVDMTRGDCELLVRCLDNYLEEEPELHTSAVTEE